jgi:predicted GNAT family acetyltransferase
MSIKKCQFCGGEYMDDVEACRDHMLKNHKDKIKAILKRTQVPSSVRKKGLKPEDWAVGLLCTAR